MMNKNLALISGVLFAVVAVVGWLVLSPRDDARTSADGQDPSSIPQGAPIVQVQLPDSFSPEAQMGKRGFEAKCVDCHGENGAGRNGIAPPLVHKIYEPSHHGDASFLLAAQNGVRSHHWNFGNMPPVDGVTRADVIAITTYVRELQRANGIN